ncbi:hypothetical protein HY230_07395 [Candidatus Acetothermia bacterium]|nr:hypothetical protein [Candidatus Acetothermia bacterium]
MRLTVMTFIALLTFICWNVKAQTDAGTATGAYVEWLPMTSFQGTQPIELPPRAITIGALAEFGYMSNGMNFRVSGGRGFGLDGPPLTLTRFDTALLFIFSVGGSVNGFGDFGTGLLQFDNGTLQFWRAIGWIGFGFRVMPFRFFMVVFELKRLAIIQLDNPKAPLPRGWVFNFEFLLVGI